MTGTGLLFALRDFVMEATGDMELQAAVQKNDETEVFRAPEVHIGRLPDSSSWKKITPYVLIQLVSAKDVQERGQPTVSYADVRFIIATYSQNEEEGAFALTDVMDRIRLKLLKEGVVAKQYKLDKQEGIEYAPYPDDTAPYYAGEIFATFIIREVERETFLQRLP